MTVHTAAFGPPVTDVDDHPPRPTVDGCAPTDRVRSITPEPDRRMPSLRSIAWGLAVIAAVVTAGASLRSFAVADTQSAEAPPPGVAGFAELYVATVLTAAGPDQADVLSPFGIEIDGIEELTPYDRYVARAAVVDITRIGTEYWSVTVGAEVLPRGEDGYGPGRLEFYAVGVAATTDGLMATGPPLPVPGPRATAPLGVAADLLGEADEATVRLVSEFLDAYFSGNGHLPRLVTRDSAIAPIADSEGVTVELVDVRSGIVENADWSTVSALVTRGPVGAQPLTVSLRIATEPGGLRVAEVVPGRPPLRTAAD